MEIGYNVPMRNQNVVQGFRIYLRGFNLFTLASNNIVDPESDYWNGRFYPQARIVSAGFSITF
jgi:hypothetical protein